MNLKPYYFVVDGKKEADWLNAAGFEQLARKFQDGKEISESLVNTAVSTLSNSQQDTVRRRVRAINETTKRKKHRHKHKPDIRDVFSEVSSIKIISYSLFFQKQF